MSVGYLLWTICFALKTLQIELGLAKDVTAIFALLWEGMHTNADDMDVISTQA